MINVLYWIFLLGSNIVLLVIVSGVAYEDGYAKGVDDTSSNIEFNKLTSCFDTTNKDNSFVNITVRVTDKGYEVEES